MVSLVPREGRQEELLELLCTSVPEVNRRFGALRVWSLAGEEGLAIVSVWARDEDLEAMRADPGYRDLLKRLRDGSAGLTDRRYRLVGGSPA